MVKHEPIEWGEIWVTGADDDSLPRLLLVGDSITRSYFDLVETELKGSFLCARLTTSTSVCDKGMKKELALLLDNYKFSVIHFNNGLHGMGYDEKSYAKGFREVLAFIMRRSPGSRLIVADSTPMRRTDDLNTLDLTTNRVRERNRIIREIAAKRRLPVNDLFTPVIDHPEHFSKDGVHFNPTGQSILGKQVIQMVLAESHRMMAS